MAWKLKDNIPPEPASVTDLIDGDLDEVTELRLVNKNLHQLPDDIDRLANLKFLDVGYNLLMCLPSSISRCHLLTALLLNSNRNLSIIQNELADLINIRYFFIGSTAITALPPGLNAWPVESLVLSTIPNNLPSWPLSSLGLWDMPAAEIEAVLHQFPAVEDLIFVENGLKALPKVITDLPLRQLSLYGQEFTEFPDLRLLPNLDKAMVSHCGVKTLPDWIGDLRNLSHLNLSFNELVTLPRQLANLGDGLDLDLSGNPLASPWNVLVEQGTPTLFNFLRSLPDDPQPESDRSSEPTDVPDQQTAPLEVAVEDGRLMARPQAGTAEAVRREFLSMYDMVKKRAAQAVQAIGDNHAKLVGLLREYQDFLGETADALQGIPLGFTGQALAIQTAHSREEDGADLLSQDQRASLEILLAAHELLMRSVPEWQDYVLKTGQRPPLSDEIDMLVRTLSRGIVVDLRQRPKEIDRHVPDRLQELVDLDAAMPAEQGQLSRWGMVDALGNVLSALAKEALATAKEIPNEARKKTALGIICLGAYAGSILLDHTPQLLALAQSLPGYGWITQVIAALRAMAGR